MDLENVSDLMDSVIADLSNPQWFGVENTDEIFSDLEKLGSTWIQIGKERHLAGSEGEKLNRLLNLLAERIYDTLRYRRAIQQFDNFESTVIQ